MPTQAFPEPDDVRTLLHSLLGRDVTVRRTTAASIDINAHVVIGIYQREDAKIGGLVVADLSIAAFTGAALSLLPAAIAKEAIADGAIEGNLLENFQEVLNIGAQWFTAKENPHVALTETYTTTKGLPNDVLHVMAGPNDRLDVEAEVTGYGSGTLRFLAMDF